MAAYRTATTFYAIEATYCEWRLQLPLQRHPASSRQRFPFSYPALHLTQISQHGGHDSDGYDSAIRVGRMSAVSLSAFGTRPP